MTKEIQKAIDFIHAYMHPVDDSESEKRKLKYRDMAIRSLEAWEKVKEEIELQKKGYPPSSDYYKAITRAVDIIDKHISGKEQG